ncbi:unnamed protein product, partial [Callosobruchus maculatus]
LHRTEFLSRLFYVNEQENFRGRIAYLLVTLYSKICGDFSLIFLLMDCTDSTYHGILTPHPFPF